MNSDFAVQINDTNPFGRNEVDVTFENTIKRDCRTKGGFGNQQKVSATWRWVLNASWRNSYKKMPREQLRRVHTRDTRARTFTPATQTKMVLVLRLRHLHWRIIDASARSASASSYIHTCFYPFVCVYACVASVNTHLTLKSDMLYIHNELAQTRV